MAQNAPPTVTITNVHLDEGAGTVTISYDLSDPEGSPCEVRLRVSMDEGITFIQEPLDISGDIGAGILPGNNRSILWNYGEMPNLLQAMVQVIADDGHVPDIQLMVDQIDPTQLMQRLEQVSIPRHHIAAPEGLQQIRDLLHSSFQQYGLATGTHTATYLGASADNVLGRHTGLTNAMHTYIVDGHYDAVEGTPGADDNGTAVAATLEIARVLSQYNFRNSLRFIGFAFEEQGFAGSIQYVQNGMPAWEQVQGVLNMEMIGYYSDEPNSQTMPAGFELLFPAAAAELEANDHRGDFLTVVGNTASDPLNNAFVAALDQYVPELKRIPLSVPGNGTIAPDLRRSDHAPFWDAGKQALMLTDGSNYRNPNYHQASDQISTIDVEFFTNCTRAVLAAAATLAGPVNAGVDSYSLSVLAGIHHHHSFPCTVEVRQGAARDHFMIHLGSCGNERIIAELFNLQGKKVKGAVLSGTAHEHRFDITGLAPGIYLLVLQAGESTMSLKVEVRG